MSIPAETWGFIRVDIIHTTAEYGRHGYADLLEINIHLAEIGLDECHSRGGRDAHLVLQRETSSYYFPVLPSLLLLLLRFVIVTITNIYH